MRICDAQTRGDESTGSPALIAACIAQAALDYDEGRPSRTPPRPREIEENLWRAIRHGMDGKLIDFERARGVPGRRGARPPAGMDRARPCRAGLEPELPERNGAQRQRRMIDAGAGMEEVFAAAVRETRETYVQEVAA